MDELISVKIDGVELRGFFKHRSKRDIAVEMTEPFENLSSRSHIPYFSYSGHCDPSFLGDYGEKRACQILENLYEIGSTVQENQGEFKQRYSEYLKDRSRLRLAVSLHEVRKQRLIQLLEQGELSRREYQDKLEKMKDRIEDLNYQIGRLFDVHFDELFDEVVSIGTRDQVIQLINEI